MFIITNTIKQKFHTKISNYYSQPGLLIQYIRFQSRMTFRIVRNINYLSRFPFFATCMAGKSFNHMTHSSDRSGFMKSSRRVTHRTFNLTTMSSQTNAWSFLYIIYFLSVLYHISILLHTKSSFLVIYRFAIWKFYHSDNIIYFWLYFPYSFLF